MLSRLASGLTRKISSYAVSATRSLFGWETRSTPATRLSRLGMASSGLFFVLGGLWISATSDRLSPAVPWGMVGVGSLVVLASARVKLTLYQANLGTLLTHFSALLSFYVLITRFLLVTYSTDTIVGSYAGLLGILNLQNPYLYSIKPFLDQFGFSPSSYTPRVDGSFEFHLNYPAFNFLSLLPLYLLGFHDLRDGVLLFHIISLIVIFGLVSSPWKAVSIAPFVFGFPLAIAYSWTDSVWASLLVLAVALWYRDKRLGLVFVGLAGATKQIALVIAPFLLIRLWFEGSEPRGKRLAEGIGALAGGFLLPNLPFIMLSPSSWWAGTVATYLPTSTPLVAGGIGLSEILSDVGIALPASFFSALTASVAVGTLILYAKRFASYNRFVWAMPAIILFFYHRSFPNYMAYWLIPLIIELFRNRPRGFAWNLPKIGEFSYRPSIIVPFHGLRRRLASSALIGLVVVGVLAGGSGAYISRVEPKIGIQVNNMADPDSIGSVTLMEVTLNNSATEPVVPRFFVKWSFLPTLWTTNLTGTLAPGSSERYVLTATDALAAVPRGTSFRVLVFNSADGNPIAQSQLLQAELPVLTITNPRFRWWILDSQTGRRTPYGWKLATIDTNLSSGIDEIDARVSEGIRLALNHTSTEGGPGVVSLSQKIAIEGSRFGLMVLQDPAVDQRFLFGTKITDGTHTLYMVFSQSAPSRSVNIQSENTTITLPVGAGVWTLVSVDPQSEWISQGWTLPKTFDMSIFVRTSLMGVYYAYVQEILP